MKHINGISRIPLRAQDQSVQYDLNHLVKCLRAGGGIDCVWLFFFNETKGE